jgi:tetratricopeptide (TPR) repeat protein
MTRIKTFASLGLLIGAVACGGGAGGAGEGAKTPVNKSGKLDKTGTHVDKAAAQAFDAALDNFASHDKKGDWADAACNEVAEQFLSASKAQESATNKKLPEALYNAGLAYQRCDKDAEARAQFEAAVKVDPQFHRARAQIALYDFEKSKDLDGTIAKLDQIIRDAKFQNVEALVSLAALQLERNGESPDQDGKNDMERAKKNLQRALAIDDAYMAAFNQLAIFYLEQAKAKSDAAGAKNRKRRGLVAASTKAKDVNSQQLDLAALVASQGVRKNPNYAPLHNTSGLIQVELKNFNGAVKSFATARRLDPKFFEAHMNYAAVNLGFRGFEEAEKAYRDAIKLRPKEYEAHLGLALAIRGQIKPGDPGGLIAKAQAELDEAKKIDGSRPETYYNEAILAHEYKTKTGSEKEAIPAFEKAAAIYRQFIDKAGADPIFADAVKRAKERSQDIDDTVKFIKEGEALKNAPPPPPPPPEGDKSGGGAAPPPPAAAKK